MCGIAGIYWTSQRPDDAAVITHRMTSVLHHRGPDSDGYAHADFADVGFRRLSIIDLGGGDQPLKNEDGTIECFLNGEIYNYKALRKDLESRGHRFKSSSDTEVLPHLYEEQGAKMFSALNGMFAVVVVDHRQRKLVIARDPFGIKQIYYAVTPRGIAFGSEMKAVLASGLFTPELDRASVVPYLTLFYSPEPWTLVRGVQELPSGCCLHFADGQVSTPERYYRLTPRPAPSSLTDDEAAEQILSLLKDSVQLQLQADVPVGISLSGGVDSSAVLYAASLVEGQELQAFTIDYGNASREEVECATAFARGLNIRHEVIRPETPNLIEELPLLGWMSDEPVADPAFYSQYCVARAARKFVTVLLTGTGGDELFGGYLSYVPSRKREWLSRFPRGLTRALAKRGLIHLPACEIEALVALQDSRQMWHCQAMSSLDPDQQAILARRISESRESYDNFARSFSEYRDQDALNQQMIADLHTYLPEQTLPMMDRATMGASIEGRVPLLDTRLVEFAFSVSGRRKMGGGRASKWLLKRAISRGVPASILNRKKMGFPSPIGELIEAEWSGLLPRLFLAPDSIVRELIPEDWLRRMFASRQSAHASFRVIYSLLVLEVWHRLMIRERLYNKPSCTIYELFRIPHQLSMAG